MFSSILRTSLKVSPQSFAIRTFTSITRQPSALALLRQPHSFQSNAIQQSITNTIPSISSLMTPVLQQLRFSSRGNHRGGNRGNTYQPSTIKRKRKLGFLARMKSVSGRKIIKRRKLKGRWYLTH